MGWDPKNAQLEPVKSVLNVWKKHSVRNKNNQNEPVMVLILIILLPIIIISSSSESSHILDFVFAVTDA